MFSDRVITLESYREHCVHEQPSSGSYGLQLQSRSYILLWSRVSCPYLQSYPDWSYGYVYSSWLVNPICSCSNGSVCSCFDNLLSQSRGVSVSFDLCSGCASECRPATLYRTSDHACSTCSVSSSARPRSCSAVALCVATSSYSDSVGCLHSFDSVYSLCVAASSCSRTDGNVRFKTRFHI